MVERYLNHLIFVKADQDPETGLWTAGTHVQFNEDPRTFRDVWLPRPNIGFRTKRNAEKQMMKEAKKWVDRRLREESQAASKSAFPGSKIAANEPNQVESSQEKERPRDPSFPGAN